MSSRDTPDRHETLQTLLEFGVLSMMTDGQLLDRYGSSHAATAELAFTKLVERHGPMVLGVCRRVLADDHLAEDAFQATFLILASRGRTIRADEALGGWLHRVAKRVAWRARSVSDRWRRRERVALGEVAVQPLNPTEHSEIKAVIDAEVDRLKSAHRLPIVLCDLEGFTHEEAARQLCWPVGTVKSRLARGRERLRARLTRRGLAPEPGLSGLGIAVQAVMAPPASLVQATIRTALTASTTSGAVAGSLNQLPQGVLRSMLSINGRTIASSIFAVAVFAAGVGAMLQGTRAPGPPPRSDQIRSDLGAQPAADLGGPTPPVEQGPPPADLAWTDVAPTERLPVLQRLAALSKGNYEQIKTWQGSYSYVQRQFLGTQFVGELLGGAGPAAVKTAPAKIDPLLQEFNSVLTFACDVGSDAIYRDTETSRMRFLRLGTDEEVKIPNVGPADHRSIVTPNVYFTYNSKDRATSSFLPDHPEAQMKRRAERFPVQEVQMREGGAIDPRNFFKFDPGNTFWRGLELAARASRGELGAEQKAIVAERLKISQAEGPGGRWYRHRVGFSNPGQPMRWVTTLWSPQVGYNPVSTVSSLDTPEGKLESKVEWQWRLIDGVYVPESFRDSAYREAGGQLSSELRATLKDCVLNQPLGPHQFDERGLGMGDGDLVLDHLERVAYIIKGGEPVKLANFGEGSVLRPAQGIQAPALAPAPAATAQPRPRPPGRIYTTASLGTNDAGRPISSVVAVDPASGEVTKLCDDSPGRLRVSPDRRTAAFVSGEWWANLPPPERMRSSLWIRALAVASEPERVLRLDGEPSGGEPVWSPDGKQLILSLGTRDEPRQRWVYVTFRINTDGSNREALAIPNEDGVQDWSPDGQWVVTASSRNAKIGWQLYVMRPDGREQRQVTEGGNPFYVRFSPDGRRLLYTDGPAPERRGIWITDLDGKNRRRLLATESGTASACWSPDGQWIAVAISGSAPEEHGRLEIVHLDGTHRTLLNFPGREIADMPDWR